LVDELLRTRLQLDMEEVGAERFWSTLLPLMWLQRWTPVEKTDGPATERRGKWVSGVCTSV
jgi:hypothetical protein